MHYFYLIFFLLLSSQCLAEKTISVSIKNNSEDLLKCSRLQNNSYIPFLRLNAGDTKYFKKFSNKNKIRCSIAIPPKAYTVLTYFSISESGEYELLKERVECTKKCGDKKIIYWATIVVFPDGSSKYTQHQMSTNRISKKNTSPDNFHKRKCFNKRRPDIRKKISFKEFCNSATNNCSIQNMKNMIEVVCVKSSISQCDKENEWKTWGQYLGLGNEILIEKVNYSINNKNGKIVHKICLPD